MASRNRGAHGGCRLPAATAVLLSIAASATAAVYTDYPDARYDWLVRPTDPGGLLPFNISQHRPIDMLNIRIGPWRAHSSNANLFDGLYIPPGEFVRLELTIAGLVNPPGSTRPDHFDPFQFGPHPIYGFIEVDMDGNIDTGGELDAPEYRYTGNAVRFGAKPPLEYLEDRFALDAAAFDGDFETAPYVDRSGEEFHLALLGSVMNGAPIDVINGDTDDLFETGETWRITAPWFHRAHGYEPFSLAFGGHSPGAYEPDCVLQFAHDAATDETTISLVFPRTNLGAALMRDEPEEPPNANPSDQFSVLEALDDLNMSAIFLDNFPTGLPEEAIIEEWINQIPDDYLDPRDWRITAILGTSYTAPDTSAEYFVWTDILPDGLRGDVNGDDEASTSDSALINTYTQAHDADDGIQDDRVILDGYPVNFTVLDVDHSGIVDALDAALVSEPGDIDDDYDVDLCDLATFQACVRGSGTPYENPACALTDIDTDGDGDGEDWLRMVQYWSGPACPDGDAPPHSNRTRQENQGP